jgi:hypothetical protein
MTVFGRKSDIGTCQEGNLIHHPKIVHIIPLEKNKLPVKIQNNGNWCAAGSNNQLNSL